MTVIDVCRNFDKDFVRRMHMGEFDDYVGVEVSVCDSDLTPKDIVDGYLGSGMYANLDYPGGIEQFVKDYRDGKFN